ncbi:phenylalanyl-tRNA synthetase, beta subunit [Synechococcus sp. PCC 7335]|uniref:phenylalanine--tRNA ligase subunit beta n=1 Tax=Synechococcus sp. (strain ATCC 29403 / PCC 7335) TaxID=91464 RepID=UPI00017EC7B8|nr:phenylalanine--tRNA ligase subunit beta [Synechococcus sp. PCC 7335]EDX87593.1 phenylalanyl-tRNA synthetase, beta subunit [Synechococcus sp. PCC 7335]
MRVSVNWLKELVEFDFSPEALAEALTMAGFEVEEIEDRRSWAEGVVVGRVLDTSPHPDAAKLSVCTVDINQGQTSTIVCGAANVGANTCVPVATVGSYLPKVDLKVKPRELRGVASAGMICSLAELGLARDSEGIYIFDEQQFEQGEISIGQDVRPLLGLDDFVLDVTSTANRADALSMVGIAREISAITGNPLKLPISDDLPGSKTALDKVDITLSEPKICPIYMGSVLEGIRIGPSPTWLQQRLIAAGTRAINNVVDVTNYVLLEWGQPLHAFDLDRLMAVGEQDSLSVSVRYATESESLVTLDDQERQLAAQTVLITANDVPVALAGVMGGAKTEVIDTTERVFLEAAYFDSAVIRKSARSQGLRTEASARYERGVNPAELKLARDRALQLFIETAGATLVGQGEDRTEIGNISPTREVSLRLSRVHQILGEVVEQGSTKALDKATVETLLSKLGCKATATDEDTWTVEIPPYRYRDLEREIDLIEEVARLYGYDRFANTLPSQTSRGYLSQAAALSRRLRAAFRGAGLTEVIHYSLTSPSSDRQVVIANPLFTEYSALRIDLLDGLIAAFELNINQGNGPLNAFEIGTVFNQPDDDPEGDPIESIKVSGIVGGDARQGRWENSNQERPLTWYEAKGILECVFDNLGLAVDYRAEARDERLHPGRTAGLFVRGRTRLGTFAQLHPELRRERDLPEAVYVFELDWAVLEMCLTGKRGKAVKFEAFSRYPASDRDLAFFAPIEVNVAELQKAMNKSGGKLLESVTLFDEYRGQGVPEGSRSLAFRLVYRASDHNLTDKDIDPIHQKIRATLEKTYKVSLRS